MTLVVPARRLLVALALGLASATLSSCGGDSATDVTCGEFADMTDGDRRDVVEEILDETNLEDEDFRDLKELGEDVDGLDQIAIGIDLECAETSTPATTLRTITGG